MFLLRLSRLCIWRRKSNSVVFLRMRSSGNRPAVAVDFSEKFTMQMSLLILSLNLCFRGRFNQNGNGRISVHKFSILWTQLKGWRCLCTFVPERLALKPLWQKDLWLMHPYSKTIFQKYLFKGASINCKKLQSNMPNPGRNGLRLLWYKTFKHERIATLCHMNIKLLITISGTLIALYCPNWNVICGTLNVAIKITAFCC